MKLIFFLTLTILFTGCDYTALDSKKVPTTEGILKSKQSLHPYDKLTRNSFISDTSNIKFINSNSAPSWNTNKLYNQYLTTLKNSRKLDNVAFLPNFPSLINNLKTELVKLSNDDTGIKLRLRLIDELMRDNQNIDAISEIDNILSSFTSNKFKYQLLHYKALAYFRKAERMCCVENFNSKSCILPVNEESFKKNIDIKKANVIWGKLLKEKPWDYQVKWMFNLTNHLLGKDVDRKIEKPFGVNINKAHPIAMDNIANELGIDLGGLAGGVIVEDFDNNGLLDVFRTSWYFDHNCRLYLQIKPNEFVDSTSQFGLAGELGGLNCVQADYNNDGFIDILILRGGWLGNIGKISNSLLKNINGKSFVNVNVENNIITEAPTHSAVWADFDNNGFLDLFISNESQENNYDNEFYLNYAGRLKKVKLDNIGLSFHTFTKGISVTDIDNDGDVDIFISSFGNDNQLYENRINEKGILHFENISNSAGVNEGKYSFSCMFFDYNNDGFDDLFVGGFGDSSVNEAVRAYTGLTPRTGSSIMYKNLGGGKFKDITKDMGLSGIVNVMGLNHGDINSDGFEDIYIGTGSPSFSNLIPNRLFLNSKGKSFEEMTIESQTGSLQKGHGIAFADFDNDNDLEMFVALGGWYTGDSFKDFLFKAKTDFSGTKIKLQGSKSNRFGVGAKVELITKNNFKVYKQLFNSSSFGNNPFTLFFGVDNSDVEKINVFWPSGIVTRLNFENIEGNFTVYEN